MRHLLIAVTLAASPAAASDADLCQALGRNADLVGATFSVVTEALNACLDAGDTHSPGCRVLLDRRDEIDTRQYLADLPLMIEIGARVCPD
jgi:hypothetical protein